MDSCFLPTMPQRCSVSGGAMSPLFPCRGWFHGLVQRPVRYNRDISGGPPRQGALLAAPLPTYPFVQLTSSSSQLPLVVRSQLNRRLNGGRNEGTTGRNPELVVMVSEHRSHADQQRRQGQPDPGMDSPGHRRGGLGVHVSFLLSLPAISLSTDC